MRVICDSCRAEFVVREGLVRGRVVKFRCKHCHGSIRVDGTALEVREAEDQAPTTVPEGRAETTAVDRLSVTDRVPSMLPPAATSPPLAENALASGTLGVDPGPGDEPGPISLTRFAEEAPPDPLPRHASAAPPFHPRPKKAEVEEPADPDPDSLRTLERLSSAPPPAMPSHATDDIVNLGEDGVLAPPAFEAYAAPPRVESESVVPHAHTVDAARPAHRREWVGLALAAAIVLGAGAYFTQARTSAPAAEPVVTPAAAPIAEIPPAPRAVETAAAEGATLSNAAENATTEPMVAPPPLTAAPALPRVTATAAVAHPTAPAIPAPAPPFDDNPYADPAAAAAAARAPAEPGPAAAGERFAATPDEPPAKVALAPEFDRSAAVAALGSASSRASACKAADSPIGVARIAVTFAPSGRATTANVEDALFAGTRTGSCLAAIFRAATVPPFSGDHVTVHKAVPMN